MPILGLATVRVVPQTGLPPEIIFTVRLHKGRPVMSLADARAHTQATGEVIHCDSILTIRLTQAPAGGGRDGWAWTASGWVDALWVHETVAVATSNAVEKLPQNAAEAVEQVKQKLGIHGGMVQAGLKATQRIAARQTFLGRAGVAKVAGAIAAGALVGGGLGLLHLGAGAATVPTAAVALASPRAGAAASPSPDMPASGTARGKAGFHNPQGNPGSACNGFTDGDYDTTIQWSPDGTSITFAGGQPTTGPAPLHDHAWTIRVGDSFDTVSGPLMGPWSVVYNIGGGTCGYNGVVFTGAIEGGGGIAPPPALPVAALPAGGLALSTGPTTPGGPLLPVGAGLVVAGAGAWVATRSSNAATIADRQERLAQYRALYADPAKAGGCYTVWERFFTDRTWDERDTEDPERIHDHIVALENEIAQLEAEGEDVVPIVGDSTPPGDEVM